MLSFFTSSGKSPHGPPTKSTLTTPIADRRFGPRQPPGDGGVPLRPPFDEPASGVNQDRRATVTLGKSP
eukprot:357773-Chlamydomonas_euryale.AAC.5